ncbi:MAG: DUF2779 domain-containing protein [Clostridia bacterium]|nr:DUF2779 domain-containing protein [Clostridia bacterium]
MIRLSKSRYTRGVSCPKALWLDLYKPEAAEAVTDPRLAEQGTEVGRLAQELYGPHVTVEYSPDHARMPEDTEKYLARGEKVICEASFAKDGCFCSADVLQNLGNGHVIMTEVKSSTAIDPMYLHDCSFQTYVIESCGCTVDRILLAHINSGYVRKGKIDIQQLFLQEDITEKVRELLPGVPDRIRSLREELEKGEPGTAIGPDCPACAYWGYCSKNLPHPNVFDLTGAECNKNKKWKLYLEGAVSFPQLAERNDLKERQRLTVTGVEKTDAQAVRDFLKTIPLPTYHLDFESSQEAVPPYEDSRPYQQIPFQYSLHIVRKEGEEPEHKEFLAEDANADPRRALAESLCRDIPADACVAAYNMAFEKTRIKELADLFPDLAEHLLAIRDNIRDLMVPFQKLYCYRPAMQGSYSIKHVLPALCPDDPELDYRALEDVHNGTEATSAFLSMRKQTGEELAKTRKNLLRYCRLDTLAMVRVWEKLKEMAEG